MHACMRASVYACTRVCTHTREYVHRHTLQISRHWANVETKPNFGSNLGTTQILAKQFIEFINQLLKGNTIKFVRLY